MEKRYRALVSQYKNQVYSLARYMLTDANDTEDISQEVYIKLWKHLENVSDTQALAWLLKVTRNACLDRIRARRNEESVNDELLGEHEKSNPEKLIGDAQIQQRLMSCIAVLPEPGRSLLILRDIHEHSYETLAQILDLSASQVKVYLYRARLALSEAFKSRISAEKIEDPL